MDIDLLSADPDRANPTRPRMERPLDTIRSFNAAAEGTSRSRASSYHGRPMSAYGSEFGGNRRSSYYSSKSLRILVHVGMLTPSDPSQVGYSPSPQRGGPRYSNGYGNGYGNGYYRNSSYGFPQENLEEMPDDRPYQPPPRQMRNPSNPNNQFYNQNGYRNGGVGYNNSINDSPMSGQHSYETMTSGSDENSKSTNPSSLNSSYDHLHQMQMRKQENHAYENQYSNDISFAPVSPQQPYANYNAPAVNGNAHQQNGNTHVRDYDPYSVPIAGPSNANGHYGAPRPPPEGMNPPNGLNPGTFNPPANNPKVPIKLNSPNSPPVVEEKKRRSWLKRTFSRKKDF